MNLKFEGKIKADQISVSEDGRLIASTEDFYWDYGEIPGFFVVANTESDPSPYGAKIVIYLNRTNQKKFSTGQTIKFKTAKEYRAAVKYYYEREELRNGPRAVNYDPQEKEKLDKDTAALLRCVQADINKIKFQAESEINEATDGIKEISERLNS